MSGSGGTEFNNIIREFADIVYNLSYRILGNSDEAKDAAQETFFKVYRKFYQYKPEMNLKNWIYTIAINTSRDVYRSRRRYSSDQLQEESISDRDNMPNKIENKIYTQEILNSLPVDYKVVVVLFYLEARPVNEISKLLKIPKVLVKVRLHRARKKILEIYGSKH
ncbi:MAG: sigma-70 family RNA polymerase sigma factor [bacterium]